MSDETVPSMAEASIVEPAVTEPEPTPAEEAVGSLQAPTAEPAPLQADEPAPAPAAPAAEPESSAAQPATGAGGGRRKLRIGKVVSTKMEKTVVVAVETRVRHALYGKFMRRTTKFKAHDGKSVCGEGDTVEIMETRPLSREKRWRVVRILEKAK